MIEREIVVKTPDGPMRVFTCRPGGDAPFPVAVLYMDAPGYRDQLKLNARQFADGGYYVAVPDLFHHFGERVTFDIAKLAEEQFQGPESARLKAVTSKLTPPLVVADTKALLAEVATDSSADPGPKVTVGYCLGARCMLDAASALPEEFVSGAGIHPGALVTDAPDSPHLQLGRVRAEL